MISNRRTACHVRRWGMGVGLAGGAVAAAAMIGAANAPAARADTIDELLLTQAEADMTKAVDLFSGVDVSSLSERQASDVEGLVSALQKQVDLISQVQLEQDALPEAAQTNPLVLDADQQLANASGELLLSSNAFVNAIDAGDFPLGHATSLAGDVTGFDAAFGLIDTELFQALPAEFRAAFAPIVAFDASIGYLGAASASATSDSNTADDVFTQATADLTQATSVLDSAPTASLDSDNLQILNSQESFITALVPTLTQQEALQNSLPAADQTNSLIATADQQFLQAYDGLLSADQAFVAADQAGDLTGQAPSLTGSLADLGLIHAELALVPANANLDFADIVAAFAGDFGLNF